MTEFGIASLPRSAKKIIRSREPRVALVGVDPVHNLQLRVLGVTRIVRDGQARLDAWRSSPDHDLIEYRTRLAPGTPVSRPDDALDETRDAPDPDEGFKHFCVVEVGPTSLDRLDHSTADRQWRALRSSGRHLATRLDRTLDMHAMPALGCITKFQDEEK